MSLVTVGDLEVSYDSPLFASSTLWYPGLNVAKSFTVKNLAGDNRTLSVTALNTEQTGGLAENLYVKFLQSGTVHYGDNQTKTMKRFWDDGQVDLAVLGSGESAAFDMEVQMPAALGNEFQDKYARFDLKIGFVGTESQVILAATASARPEQVTILPAATVAATTKVAPILREILATQANKVTFDFLPLLFLLMLAFLFFLWLRRQQPKDW